MSDKCPLCGDSMIFTLYSAHMDEDGTTRDEQCCHIVDGEACLRRQLAALQEENAELKGVCRKGLDALLSIRAAGDYIKAEGVGEAIDALREAAEENPDA